jgi:hypothetical protein
MTLTEYRASQRKSARYNIEGETSVSKNSLRRYTTIWFVFVVSVALVGVDLVVLAQNSNE